MVMTSAYCVSSSRNTVKPRAFLIHDSNFHHSKHKLPFFSLCPKKDSSILQEKILPLKLYFPTLRVENYNLTRPFASLSSFAEADGDESSGKVHALNEHQENEKPQEDLQGMAQAFNISSSTATAISICIALAALCFPYFMNSLGQGMSLKTKLLSYGTLLFGFYMAWNIGANDVANAMGTSVGSGALTLRQAVLTAAVLEFSGALLMGKHVTSTMQKGILVANVFQGKDTLLLAGLLSSLAAAGTWLQVHCQFNYLFDSLFN